jgi:xanthine dehydrogenase YagR molybdenum-binding subunit
MLSELFEFDDTTAAKPAAAPYTPSSIIGASVPRIDGPFKTSGRATYAADHSFPRMVYAVPVGSTVGSGKIVSLDASVAEKMPGVLLVLRHDNIAEVLTTPANGRSGISEGRPVLSDDNIHYWGQYVALAVAETFEQAQAAAAAVRVRYDAQTPDVSPVLNDANVTLNTPSKRGDTDSAFTSAPVQVDETYSTPVETHNPMEMHASVAVWDGKNLTLYESSQNVDGYYNSLANALSVPKENLRVISRFIGSGFGSKLSPWPNSILAAAASR